MPDLSSRARCQIAGAARAAFDRSAFVFVRSVIEEADDPVAGTVSRGLKYSVLK